MNKARLVILVGHLILGGVFDHAPESVWAQSSITGVQTQTKPEDSIELPLLKLNLLISELFKQNPGLQAERKRFEAALTRPPQESALPDPRITIGWIGNGGPWPGAG